MNSIGKNRIRRGNMNEIFLLLIIVGVWYLLQAYILPKLGISTWVQDSCQVTSKKGHAEEQISQKKDEDLK